VNASHIIQGGQTTMSVLQRLAREPAAGGTLVASVLPALVALGIVSIDEKTIGVLVVAVNAVVGFILRTFVTPAGAGATPRPATT
jgi:hypothetical protein